jgi:hypothetical protein
LFDCEGEEGGEGKMVKEWKLQRNRNPTLRLCVFGRVGGGKGECCVERMLRLLMLGTWWWGRR